MEVERVWDYALSGEVAFWKRFITGKQFARYSKAPLLKSYFAPMMEGKTKVSILDIGSGACPTGGWTWPGVDVHFVQADALAEQYLTIYDELGIVPPLPIEEQNMTAMTYSDASFDIVHCRNALNHCADPLQAVREMVRVSREWVCLSHGEAPYAVERYKGMHLWHISMADDGKDVVIWGKDNKFLLSECVLGFSSYSDPRQYKKTRIVMSYLRKN